MKAFVFLGLIACVAFVLNCPCYLIERTTVMHRIADPALMLIGLIGSVFRLKLLRLLGWVAILWFVPAILYSTPDMEHANSALEGFPIFWRLATTFLLCIALAVVFGIMGVRRSASAITPD